jgi:hypothetical protein
MKYKILTTLLLLVFVSMAFVQKPKAETKTKKAEVVKTIKKPQGITKEDKVRW